MALQILGFSGSTLLAVLGVYIKRTGQKWTELKKKTGEWVELLGFTVASCSLTFAIMTFSAMLGRW